MKVPNADRAIVDIRKLRDYCLDPTHRTGKHKARVFLAASGMTAIRSAWIIELGRPYPRLTSCYVLEE